MFKKYRIGMMISACILLFSGLSHANVLLDRVVAVVDRM